MDRALSACKYFYQIESFKKNKVAFNTFIRELNFLC